ncbi:MAG: hypothetical protein ACLS8T_42510 [Anaerobutyricum sp.]
MGWNKTHLWEVLIYNRLEKAARNNEYLAMIDRSIAQLEAGKGQEHELIEIDE